MKKPLLAIAGIGVSASLLLAGCSGGSTPADDAAVEITYLPH